MASIDRFFSYVDREPKRVAHPCSRCYIAFIMIDRFFTYIEVQKERRQTRDILDLLLHQTTYLYSGSKKSEIK